MILCGGAGERLWPASRPERPKPFLKLMGDRSGFQQALLRAAPLAESGQVVVLGSESHAGLIADQLAEIGATAVVLLEPVGRDTAAAIAEVEISRKAGGETVHKIKRVDKKGALDSLARALGLFRDRLETGESDNLAERLDAARKRVGL